MEFALLMPFFIAMCAFLIEMCFYWDATVMANHTAFTIARIAKVNVKREKDEDYRKNPHVLQKQTIQVNMPKVQFNLLEKVLPNLTKSENLVTVMMMGTTTMGFMPTGGSTPGNIRSEIKALVRQLIQSIFPSIPKMGNSSNLIIKFFYKIIDKVIDAINKIIEDIGKWVADLIGSILDPLIDLFFDLLQDRGSRIFSQIYAAHQNVTKHKDVIEIGTISSDADGAKVITMKYPQHYNTKKVVGTTIDKPLYVAVHFPQTTNWIYSYFLEGATLEKPRVHGHAIMMPEPVLTEIHLKASEKAIPPPETSDDEEYETKYAEYAYLRRELPKSRGETLTLVSKKALAYHHAKRNVEAIKLKQRIMQLEKELEKHPEDVSLQVLLKAEKKNYTEKYQGDFDYDTLDASGKALNKAKEAEKKAKAEYDEKAGLYDECKEVEFELWKWNWDRVVQEHENTKVYRRGNRRQVLIQQGGNIATMLKKKKYYMNTWGHTRLWFTEKKNKYIYSIPLAGDYQALHPCCFERDTKNDWGAWCWRDRNYKKKIGKWPPVAPADSTFPAKKKAKEGDE